MSSIHDYSEAGNWDNYFSSWLQVEPPENFDLDPADLSDEEIEQMREEMEAKEYFENHPSLSAHERNPNLN